MLTTEQRTILLDLIDPDGGEVDLLTRQRNAIDAALAELDALRAEVEKLRAENERLRGQEGSQSVLNL
jgi:cell division protein FtsB